MTISAVTVGDGRKNDDEDGTLGDTFRSESNSEAKIEEIDYFSMKTGILDDRNVSSLS